MKVKLLLSLCVTTLSWGCVSTEASLTQPDKIAKLANKQALLDSEMWLENNLKNTDVMQTESGLQYKVIKNSHGCYIDATQNVTVHYEALLPQSGLVFDSSYKRGYPSIFPLNKVIIGWTEGVSSMKIGEIRELYVHPKLAYGEKGSLPIIEPNVVTQYKVELINATCL